MQRLATSIRHFLFRDDGPTAVEYAVMLMLIILACLAAITMVGGAASTSFENSSTSISDIMVH